MTDDLSALRRQLLNLQAQLPPLLETFLGREPLLPGSLYTLRRRCGKPSCRCTRGQLHSSTVLAYRGQGGPRNIIPTPEELPAVRKLTSQYRQFRQARTQLLRLERQMRKLIDRLEAARIAQGERRFPRFCSPSQSRSRR